MRPAADLIVTNARLWSGVPLPDADALAVVNGRLAAIGRAADVNAWRGPRTRVIDAAERTVTPGLCDAHVHLLAWARALDELDLGGCATRQDALARVARHVSERPGDGTIVGRGWQSDAWEAAPDHASLDLVTGDRPVLLHGKDYHSLWVNGAVLKATGITRDTPDPSGGRIERDASGAPTGVLREHAVRLVAELERAAARPAREPLGAAIAKLHAHGVTAVHDFEGAEAFHALREVSGGASPSLRVLMHLPHASLDHALAVGLESGVGDDAFRVGAIKLFADGTLGSRTAALLEPYDGTDERGLDLLSDAELRDAVARAFAGGLSVAVHAIGDRAVRRSLDAFQAARDRIPSLALPPRIEHAQLIADDDVPRFAALGVAASMQPAHCTSDVPLANRWWSTRTRRSYPWQSLLASGALLAFGSDAPVEPPSVAAGLAAALTRRRLDGGAYAPEQCVDLDRALAAYTRGPAMLAGGWPRVGCLAPGAWADFVIWNGDLHALEPDDLGAARPALTALAGAVVYEHSGASDSSRRAAATDRRVTA